MNEPEVNMLVCSCTEKSPHPVYGSVRARCDECGASVWVSLSGQKALGSDETLTPFCVECAKEKVADAGDRVKAEIVPGAIDELKRHFLKVREN